MEIIEHGKTYQIRTCPYCKCVFATCEKDFEGKDLRYDYLKNAYYEYFTCPECGSEIEFEK